MTPVEIIYAAADYMEAHGKATGRPEDTKGRVCAIGAVRKVTRSRRQRGAADNILTRQAQAEGWRGIIHYSDGNDKRKVVRFMRRAARLYEKGRADGWPRHDAG